MIKEWLEEYKPKTQEAAVQALREIMQEIALAGLYRSGFFEKAAFYGGTALRIFHGLPRFSEDLDFSLLEVNKEFSLEPYLEGIENEFQALGVSVSIKEKSKTAATNIDSAFLKSGTAWKEVIIKEILPQEGVKAVPEIKIKLEVDKKPPPGFETEEKLLVKPFSFYTKCFVLPDLFAGKMHALLFRKWKKRVKGRDWFDMEWYIKKGVPLDLDHFLRRSVDSGDWKKNKISIIEFMSLLLDKINSVSFDSIREDVVRFIPDEKAIGIWSAAYFKDLIQQIKFTKGFYVLAKNEWSQPKPVEAGKNIRVHSSKGGVGTRIVDTTNNVLEKTMPFNHRTMEFRAKEIAGIGRPMIQFRIEKGEALVEFEWL